MKIIKFERNGTMREWYDKHKNYHNEEMIDVFIDNKKLSRGMCGVIFRQFMKIKKGESKEFVMNDESSNLFLIGPDGLCETSGLPGTPCNAENCNQGCLQQAS